MASLESKLLDGANAGYCSSSEGEDESGWKVSNDDDTHQQNVMRQLPGTSNTGAKGVLSDFQLFREEVMHHREQKNQQIVKQAQRGMMESSKEERERVQNGDDDDDETLENMRAKRLQEMRKALTGRIFEITDSKQYLEASESNTSSLILVMIYEPGHEGSEHLTHIFKILAADFPDAKFLRANAALLGTTKNFKTLALPTLQVFFNGALVGNFVCVDKQLPEEYTTFQLIQFLERKRILLRQNRYVEEIDEDDDYDSD
ncbi:unnamed protein product, partial [Mesorhabditis belari]|uniref:Phosducin thioredoxin-like domain-containing protein n=1 Tax=Mesorhabditis belari TaxID=2138241 RepID=A0AAF3FFB8_9BILA